MALSITRAWWSSFAASLAMIAACAEPECPGGYTKQGKVCRRVDSGHAFADDGGDPADTDAVSADDTGASKTDAGSAVGLDDANVMTDASSQIVDAANMIAASDGGGTEASADAGPPPAAPECDATRACAPGLVCSSMKCLSACTQIQCNPNATCSLAANVPTCSCNRGYTAASSSGTGVTCVRNLACDQLGCDAKAVCEGTQEDGFRCTCLNGYTGDGKTCTPVTCEPPPTIANLTWPAGSVTHGNTITGRCNQGFEHTQGNLTLLCDAERKWVGTLPGCSPVDCGSLAIAFGAVDTTRGTKFGSPPAAVTCQDDFVRSGPATVECQSNRQWSKPPRCLGCGDGEITNIPNLLQETCDPKADGANIWTCNASCQRTSAYTFRACGDDSMCEGNDTCIVIGQFCVQQQCAASGSTCPSTPKGSKTIAACIGGGFMCLPSGCTSASDCAPGLTCARLEDGKFYCYPCSTGDDRCPPGTKCTPYTNTTPLGHCTKN
jgi:hypothetical protein